MNNTSLELLVGVDGEFANLYSQKLSVGIQTAADLKVAVVAICRDVEEYLPRNLAKIDELVRFFAAGKVYIFENDSNDKTPEILRHWATSRSWATVETTQNDRPRLNGFERERTVALAEYRNKCLDWVRINAADSSFTVVLDLDGEWFVDGVLNSVGWLAEKAGSQATPQPAGMASYSICVGEQGVFFHYDAYAARMNWWSDRRETMGYWWLHMWYPPVGSPPVPLNSAFGGLTVYSTAAYLSGHYSGEDCEHVPFHRRIAKAGYRMWLNPSSRWISNWTPQISSEQSAPAGNPN
jgi:hypothetical protein